MINKTAKAWVRVGAVVACLLTLLGCHAAAPAPAGAPSPTSIATPAPGPSPTRSVATPAPGVVTSIPMPTPGAVVTAFGSVWIANGPSPTLTRLDPRTDKVIDRIATPDPASVVGVGAGAIWLTSYPGNSLSRIDPKHDRVTRTISLAPGGAGAIGVTVFRGFVWVANHDGAPTTSVSKIDPATMRVVDVIPVGAGTDAGPQWIIHGAGSIWTNVNADPNVVVRIDPHTDRTLATIPAPSACAQLAADNTTVWGASGDDPSCTPGVSRIDAHTNTVTATFDEGGAADAVALYDGSLWYGTTTTHLLGRIDTRTNKVVSLLDLPGPAFNMTAGFHAIWTSNRDGSRLYKVLPPH